MKIIKNYNTATKQNKLNELTTGELSNIRGGGRAPQPQPPPFPWEL